MLGYRAARSQNPLARHSINLPSRILHEHCTPRARAVYGINNEGLPPALDPASQSHPLNSYSPCAVLYVCRLPFAATLAGEIGTVAIVSKRLPRRDEALKRGEHWGLLEEHRPLIGNTAVKP